MRGIKGSVAGVWTAAVLAVGTGVASAQEQAAGWSAELPEFAYIAEVQTNVLILNDPLPWVRQIAGSESLFEPMRQMVQVLEGEVDPEFGGGGPDIPSLEERTQAIEQAAMFIPARVVIAADETGLQLFPRIWEGMAYGGFAAEAHAQGLAEPQKAMIERLTQLVKAYREPRVTIVATMRDESTALLGMQQAQQMMGFVQGEAGMTVEVEADRVSLAMDMRTVGGEGPGAAMREMVDEMELAEGGDPATSALAASFADIKFKMQLRREGATLIFNLGDPVGPGEAVMTSAGLGERWLSGGEPLLFAAANVKGAMACILRSESAGDELRNQPLGRVIMTELAESNMGRTVLPMVLRNEFSHQLKSLGEAVSMRLSVEGFRPDWVGGEGDLQYRIQAHVWVDVPPAAPGLAQSLPLSRIPAGMPLVSVDAQTSLGDLLQQIGSSVVDREQIYWHARMEADFEELAAKGIYKEKLKVLLPLENMLVRDAEPIFVKGLGVLADAQGYVEDGTVKATVDGETSEFRLEDAPLPRGVMLARIADKASAVAYMQKLYGMLATMTAEELGEELDAEQSRMLTVDLGLNETTFTVNPDTLNPFLEEMDLNLTWDLKSEDARPHVVVLDDLMIFSTSPVLSQQVIATWKGQAPGMEMPADAPEQMQAWGQMDAAPFAVALRSLADKMSLHVGDERQSLSEPAAIMTFAASMAELLGKTQVVTWDESGVRRGIWTQSLGRDQAADMR